MLLSGFSLFSVAHDRLKINARGFILQKLAQPKLIDQSGVESLRFAGIHNVLSSLREVITPMIVFFLGNFIVVEFLRFSFPRIQRSTQPVRGVAVEVQTGTAFELADCNSMSILGSVG